MKRQFFNCGIDVSKDNLDVYITPINQFRQFQNSPKGLKQLIQFLKGFTLSRVVLEASGGYERLCLDTLSQEGFPLVLMNPTRIRQFAKAMGILAKTDQVDAKVIALFAEKIEPPLTVLPDELNRQLKSFFNYRQHLMKTYVSQSNYLKTVSDSYVRLDIKRTLKSLKLKIAKVETHIRELLSNHPLKNLLSSAPGIGEVSVWALLAHLPELGHLDRRSIAALVGLAPYNRDSGKQRGKRYIQGGRSELRCILYMGVMSTLQKKHKPTSIKRFYDSLIAKGKASKVAITACMRKLVVTLNAMVKNGEYWREDRAV